MEKVKEISPASLLYRARNGYSPLLLDVRNEEDFGSWKIDFIKNQVNIPYIDFIEDPDTSFSKIPPADEIVVLCGKGGASAYVADILRSKGVSAMNVSGGMKAWGSIYIHTKIWAQDGASVTQFNRVGKGCLSYMLVAGGECAVIDASRHFEQYIAHATSHNVKITHVFDTHLHADHLSGGARLAQAVAARYYAGDADMAGATLSFTPLEDGTAFAIGGKALKVVSMASPGHTPGSTSFLFADKVLFTGDTLFISSMGRPDLGGHAKEWAGDLWKTVHNYAKFGDSVIAAPSHTAGLSEYDADWRVMRTLGELRRTNHLLTIRDEEAFLKETLSHLPAEPEEYQKMRKANLGLDSPDEQAMEQWELGKNRCALETARDG
jgi:glyoxylase-like metal-dependent hydrolase (beta-lactamase superfamily II)